MNRILYNLSKTNVPYSQNISQTGHFVRSRKIKPQMIDAVKQYHAIFIKLSKAQIKQANAMAKPDAAKFYYGIICDGMKIPKELRPELKIVALNETNSRLSGQYNAFLNEILYFTENRTNKRLGNWWIFGLMRHELEHFRQTIDIMRNKDLFNDYCNYVKSCIQKYDFSNVTKEDLAEEGVKNIEELKIKFINEMSRKLNKFRKKILKHYPEIKKNSDEYIKAKKYLDGERKYEEYGNPSNKYGLLKYLFLIPNEFHACKTQGLNWLNYFITSLIG